MTAIEKVMLVVFVLTIEIIMLYLLFQFLYLGAAR